MIKPKTITDLFVEDIQKYGYITEENFLKFLTICSKFANEQLTVKTAQGDFGIFIKDLNLNLVKKKLPENKELITQTFEKIQSKLSLLPFVPTHGDFNSSILFENKDISFKGFHLAPFGYDLVSALYSTYFTPKDSSSEITQQYEFSKNQRATFIYSMNKLSIEHGIPQFTEFTGEFILCRAVFAAVRMDHTPKLQAWRYKVLKALLTDYLDGRRIKLPALVGSIGL